MGDIRDKLDLVVGRQNAARAAQAGGPKRIARLGRPRGSDRIGAKHTVKRRR